MTTLTRTITTLPADLSAAVLAALCVVGIIVLTALGQVVPDVLVTIALVSVGVSGGAALPRTARATPTPPPAPAQVFQP